MKNPFKLIGLLSLLVLFLFHCKKAPGPIISIDTISPSSGPPGTLITLFGERLNYWNKIRVGDQELSDPDNLVLDESGAVLSFRLPSDLQKGVVDISLIYEEGESNDVPFEVVAPNGLITSVFPQTADIGDTITIYGSDLPVVDIQVCFINSQSITTVQATSIFNITADSLQVIVPSGAGYDFIQLKNLEGNSNVYTFNLVLPQVISVSPDCISAGELMIIKGRHFKEEGLAVHFQNTIPGINPTFLYDTLILVEVPDLMNDVNISALVQVETVNGVSNSFVFTIKGGNTDPVPVIFGENTTYVSPGCTLLLSGSNFDLTTAVFFNGTLYPGTWMVTPQGDLQIDLNDWILSLGESFNISLGYGASDVTPPYGTFTIINQFLKSIVGNNNFRGGTVFIYGDNFENGSYVVFKDQNGAVEKFEIGAASSYPAQFIILEDDSYAREYYDAEGFIVTRIPNVWGVVDISIEFGAACTTDSIPINVSTGGLPFNGNGGHGVIIPVVPPGVSLASIFNDWLFVLTSNDFALNIGADGCTPDTCSITDIFGSYLGNFARNGSFCRIFVDGQWYVGSQSMFYGMSVLNVDNAVYYPHYIRLFGEDDGTVLEMIHPARVDVAISDPNGAGVYDITLFGLGLSNTDEVYFYESTVNFPLMSLYEETPIDSISFFDLLNYDEVIFTIENIAPGTYTLLVKDGLSLKTANTVQVDIQ